MFEWQSLSVCLSLSSCPLLWNFSAPSLMPNYISKVRVPGLLLLIESYWNSFGCLSFCVLVFNKSELFKSPSTDVCVLQYNIHHIAESAVGEKGKKEKRVIQKRACCFVMVHLAVRKFSTLMKGRCLDVGDPACFKCRWHPHLSAAAKPGYAAYIIQSGEIIMSKWNVF